MVSVAFEEQLQEQLLSIIAVTSPSSPKSCPLFHLLNPRVCHLQFGLEHMELALQLSVLGPQGPPIFLQSLVLVPPLFTLLLSQSQGPLREIREMVLPWGSLELCGWLSEMPWCAQRQVLCNVPDLCTLQLLLCAHFLLQYFLQ